MRPVSAGRSMESKARSMVPDCGVEEVFGSGSVEEHVVGGPAAAELVAAGGQLSDEVGEVAVVGVAAGFAA